MARNTNRIIYPAQNDVDLHGQQQAIQQRQHPCDPEAQLSQPDAVLCVLGKLDRFRDKCQNPVNEQSCERKINKMIYNITPSTHISIKCISLWFCTAGETLKRLLTPDVQRQDDKYSQSLFKTCRPQKYCSRGMPLQGCDFNLQSRHCYKSLQQTILSWK